MSSDRIYVVLMGLSWIVGKFKLDKMQLEEPRLYFFNAKEHGCMSLPGNPTVITVPNGCLIYKLTDGETKDVYLKHTSPIDKVEIPKIILAK